MPESEIFLYTDGAARGNPGHAGAGYKVVGTGRHELAAGAACIGFGTNYFAEYTALIRGLSRCSELTTGRVRCTADNETVVKQMNGANKVRSADLKPLYEQVKGLEKRFTAVSYTHHGRSHPEIAAVDRMVNAALDACERFWETLLAGCHLTRALDQPEARCAD